MRRSPATARSTSLAGLVLLVSVLAMGIAAPAAAGAADDANAGILAAERGKSESAMELLTSAIASNELTPEHGAKVFLHRGRIHARASRADEALADFDAALGLRPGYAEAHLARGRLHEGAGRFEAAVEDYGAAIVGDPDNEHAYNRRCYVYARLDRADRAIGD